MKFGSVFFRLLLIQWILEYQKCKVTHLHQFLHLPSGAPNIAYYC
jgi:hypothetical protein